jgi:hypothetical protein
LSNAFEPIGVFQILVDAKGWRNGSRQLAMAHRNIATQLRAIALLSWYGLEWLCASDRESASLPRPAVQLYVLACSSRVYVD